MPIATNPKTGEVVFLDKDGAWKPAQRAVNPETQEAMAFDGQDWKALPASKGIMGYIDDAVRSIASGVTFGFADELAAAGDAALGKGSYKENVRKERARDKQIPAAISIPGEIAGGVGGTLAAAPALIAAAPAAIKQTLQGLPALIKYLGIGAVEGGIAGAGHAEEGETLSNAAAGAGIGAVAGPVVAGAVKGVQATARGVRHALSPTVAAKADLARAIARDQDTPAGVASRLASTQADRPGASVADVGGENVRGLTERIAQTPGAGRTEVVPALTKRQQEQATRISEDLKSLTGANKSAIQTIEEVMEDRAREARPLYDKAMAFDAKQEPEIVNKFLATIKTGWGKAIVSNPSFRRTLETEFGIDPKNIKDTPAMVLIDAFKKEADGLIGEATRRGNKNQARVLSKMRDDLVGVVDKFNPDYPAARASWAGKSAYMDAVEEGRDILGKNVSAEELAGRFSTMPAAQKEAYRIGAVSAIINRMGSDPAKLGDMTKYLRSPEMLKKVAAMMPTPEAAQSWLKRIQFEVGASELSARALGNSATARRLAEQQDAKDLVGDLVMDAIMQGSVSGMSIVNRALQFGPKWLKDTLRSRTDKVLADMLMNPARGADVGRLAPTGASSAINPLVPAAATAGVVNVAQ
jgi:hypothetical protein